MRRASDGKPGVVAAIQAGFQGAYLEVGSSRAFVGTAARYRMRIYLDKRTIEVYVNDGAAAIYNPVDAEASALGIAVFGRAGAGRGGAALAAPRLDSLRIWPMKAARFSLDRFHV